MGYKVIVSINKENQIQYIELFRKAYEFLWEKDEEFRKQYPKDPKDEGNENLRFTSLNHYYANMAKFFGYKNYRYVMLPVDENPLVIDLNAKTIKIEANKIINSLIGVNAKTKKPKSRDVN